MIDVDPDLGREGGVVVLARHEEKRGSEVKIGTELEKMLMIWTVGKKRKEIGEFMLSIKHFLFDSGRFSYFKYIVIH